MIEIGGGDLTRKGGLDQLLLTVVSDTFGFEIGTKATDSDHTGKALEIDRA